MTILRQYLAIAPALLLACSAVAQKTELSAPNVVSITSRLVTSGQPSAQALAGLSAQGFEAVIYLAPPTVPDAVRDEALIVGRQGLVFVNIPVKFDNPTEQDYEAFASVLGALSKRKVLVHRQINLRASSMVFLNRVIAAKESPHAAYESVASVWSPDGPWKRFILGLLRKHGLTFEPYWATSEIWRTSERTCGPLAISTSPTWGGGAGSLRENFWHYRLAGVV